MLGIIRRFFDPPKNAVEALDWLGDNPNEAAVGCNRFHSTEMAIRFVQSLYDAGAEAVAVPRDRVFAEPWRIAQFDQSYSDFLRGGNDPAASEQSFRELIATWTIDWNSCEFRNGTAFDSWGTAIEIRTDAPAIHLRSAGPDRRFGTSDDIARQIGRGPAA